MMRPKTLNVFRVNDKGKYFATVRIDNKTKFLGSFRSKKEAISAVKKSTGDTLQKGLVCYY